MIKKIASIVFLSLLLLYGCGEKSTSDSLNWHTNLDEALKIAKKENRAVLVNFTGSDWCQWCFKLSDEVFSQDEFKNYAEKNLVLVKVDFPRHKEQSPAIKYYNQQLASRFGVRGFPTIILLNSSGKVIAVTGYRPGGALSYIQHIQSYL